MMVPRRLLVLTLVMMLLSSNIVRPSGDNDQSNSAMILPKCDRQNLEISIQNAGPAES